MKAWLPSTVLVVTVDAERVRTAAVGVPEMASRSRSRLRPAGSAPEVTGPCEGTVPPCCKRERGGGSGEQYAQR